MSNLDKFQTKLVTYRNRDERDAFVAGVLGYLFDIALPVDSAEADHAIRLGERRVEDYRKERRAS